MKRKMGESEFFRYGSKAKLMQAVKNKSKQSLQLSKEDLEIKSKLKLDPMHESPETF